MINNNFLANSGTMGLVVLELNRKKESRLLVAKNSFHRSGSYIGSSIFRIILYGNDSIDVLNTVPDNTTAFCTGLHFEDNMFYKCNGCSMVIGSLIDVYCLNRNSTILRNGTVIFEDLKPGVSQ